MTVLGPPWRFDGEQPPTTAPSPDLGEHNDVVYRDLLGLSAAEIAELKDDGVI